MESHVTQLGHHLVVLPALEQHVVGLGQGATCKGLGLGMGSLSEANEAKQANAGARGGPVGHQDEPKGGSTSPARRRDAFRLS